MSSFPVVQYAPKKFFTPISLKNNNKTLQRAIYKPLSLGNRFNQRPVLNQGLKMDVVPTSLTVPHENKFNTSIAPNNPMNIVNFNPIQPMNKLIPMNANNNISIPRLNNFPAPISQNSIVVNGNVTPRVMVPIVSNNNIINNQSVVGSNIRPISIMSVKDNNLPNNNMNLININNTPNPIPPLNNFTSYIQPPKIINVNTPPTPNIINVNPPQPPNIINLNPISTPNIIKMNTPQTSSIIINPPQPPKIVNVNPPLPITPIIPLNNIPISNTNAITYQNSFVEPGEQINLKEYELLGEIGKGSFGKIYKVKWKVNQKCYALKAETIDDPHEIKTRLHRGKAMRDFVQNTLCEGVVNILGSYIIKKGPVFHYFELMELCDDDFEKEIKLRSNFGAYYSEKELNNIIKQLISTLSILQKRHITHRDIKPQNILISKGKYKLCDFGDIRVMQRDGEVIQRIRGSELYMSPILFNALRRGVQQVEHNTYKSDVFSLGMCLFYAACLSFDGPVEIREINDMNMKSQILNKYLRARYSQKLIKILHLMLQTEEINRPDFIMLENAILTYGL